MLEIHDTKLAGVKVIIPPTVFEDYRGFYINDYHRATYTEAGIPEMVEDDYCASYQNVLRGMHGDDRTSKLVSCPYGRIYHVVVNNNPDSPQYLQWAAFFLSDQNRKQVLVPPKFGNGYLVLSDWALFRYKQSHYYEGAQRQFTLNWADPKIGIFWPTQTPILSERDAKADLL